MRSRSKTPARKAPVAPATSSAIVDGDELLQIKQDIDELKQTLDVLVKRTQPQRDSSARSPVLAGILGLELHDGGYDDAFAMLVLLGVLVFMLGAADDMIQMLRCLGHQQLPKGRAVLLSAAMVMMSLVGFLLRHSYDKGFETTVQRYIFQPVTFCAHHWRLVGIFSIVTALR
jgi:hypothetical protein